LYPIVPPGARRSDALAVEVDSSPVRDERRVGLDRGRFAVRTGIDTQQRSSGRIGLDAVDARSNAASPNS